MAISWRSQDRFVLGADLGQSADPTAVCVLQCYSTREDPADPARVYFDVRHLMRLPLGMSYPAIVNEVGLMLSREPLRSSGAELVIDETGVGRAVGDIFAQSGLKPIRVTITAGNEEAMAGARRYTVPKGVLISTLDARLHTGELRFAKELREAAAMESELKDFRRHVSEAGRYSFEARSGKHDDLVLAVAIALWRAVRHKPRFDDGGMSVPKVILGYQNVKRPQQQLRSEPRPFDVRSAVSMPPVERERVEGTEFWISPHDAPAGDGRQKFTIVRDGDGMIMATIWGKDAAVAAAHELHEKGTVSR